MALPARESELTDDYFMTYTATKVSVSDESVTSGSKLVVYTRIWNNATHKYEFYAIDHDGSLHRCYESGDQIQWVGSKANTLLWEFTEYRDEVTQEVNHVRVDEVTNKRSGVVIRKTDWEAGALAGATFELHDEAGGLIGTFKSDENGDVTIAFLRPDATYTLTETKAPQGYRGLPEGMTITQEHSGRVTVGGVDEEWYDLEQTLCHHGHRELTIKDRPFTLELVKVDADSGLPLSGVEFSLNKVVVVDGMTTTRPSQTSRMPRPTTCGRLSFGTPQASSFPLRVARVSRGYIRSAWR